MCHIFSHRVSLRSAERKRKEVRTVDFVAGLQTGDSTFPMLDALQLASDDEEEGSVVKALMQQMESLRTRKSQTKRRRLETAIDAASVQLEALMEQISNLTERSG